MYGDRVQIPAHTDRWMRGDRYGTLIALTRTAHTIRATVRMERSGDLTTWDIGTLTSVA